MAAGETPVRVVSSGDGWVIQARCGFGHWHDMIESGMTAWKIHADALKAADRMFERLNTERAN